jgi:hypothetical protein
MIVFQLSTLNAILTQVAKTGDDAIMNYYLNQMKEYRIRPDTYTYHAQMKCSGNQKNYIQMKKIYKELQENAKTNTYTYIIMLTVAVKCEPAFVNSRIEEILDLMKKDNIFPDRIILHILLQYYYNVNAISKMEEIFDYGKKLRLSFKSFALMGYYYLSHTMIKEFLGIAKRMKEELEPQLMLNAYNAILKLILTKNSPNFFEEMKLVFTLMKKVNAIVIIIF